MTGVRTESAMVSLDKSLPKIKFLYGSLHNLHYLLTEAVWLQFAMQVFKGCS